MAYIAAILARAGHEVKWTRGDDWSDGDVAIVLSSLVDYKNETAWADRMRARGVKVGLHRHHRVEDAASCSQDHCDFIVNGEPEAARRCGWRRARFRRASSSASRSTISIRCRFRAGTW